MTLGHRGIIAAAAAAAIVIVATVIALSSGTGHRNSSTRPTPNTAAPALSSTGQSGWTSVPPLTDVPAQTPVQQQYDAALASGLSASSTIQAAEAASIPTPAVSTSWPALALANTPEAWVSEFVNELLDIDFARQSIKGLGQWLSAQEAPELLPGIPAAVANKALYLSVLEPSLVQGASPIPTAVTWQTAAQAGTRWQVSNVIAQPDPQFSQIVASGWEPIDQRFDVEEVTGTLTSTDGAATTAKDFSMAVYVGSAHWHAGYGTVLVSDWKES